MKKIILLLFLFTGLNSIAQPLDEWTQLSNITPGVNFHDLNKSYGGYSHVISFPEEMSLDVSSNPGLKVQIGRVDVNQISSNANSTRMSVSYSPNDPNPTRPIPVGVTDMGNGVFTLNIINTYDFETTPQRFFYLDINIIEYKFVSSWVPTHTTYTKRIYLHVYNKVEPVNRDLISQGYDNNLDLVTANYLRSTTHSLPLTNGVISGFADQNPLYDFTPTSIKNISDPTKSHNYEVVKKGNDINLKYKTTGYQTKEGAVVFEMGFLTHPQGISPLTITYTHIYGYLRLETNSFVSSKLFGVDFAPTLQHWHYSKSKYKSSVTKGSVSSPGKEVIELGENHLVNFDLKDNPVFEMAATFYVGINSNIYGNYWDVNMTVTKITFPVGMPQPVLYADGYWRLYDDDFKTQYQHNSFITQKFRAVYETSSVNTSNTPIIFYDNVEFRVYNNPDDYPPFIPQNLIGFKNNKNQSLGKAIFNTPNGMTIKAININKNGHPINYMISGDTIEFTYTGTPPNNITSSFNYKVHFVSTNPLNGDQETPTYTQKFNIIDNKISNYFTTTSDNIMFPENLATHNMTMGQKKKVFTISSSTPTSPLLNGYKVTSIKSLKTGILKPHSNGSSFHMVLDSLLDYEITPIITDTVLCTITGTNGVYTLKQYIVLNIQDEALEFQASGITFQSPILKTNSLVSGIKIGELSIDPSYSSLKRSNITSTTMNLTAGAPTASGAIGIKVIQPYPDVDATNDFKLLITYNNNNGTGPSMQVIVKKQIQVLKNRPISTITIIK